MKAVLNAFGQEVPDSTPLAPPVGYRRQPSLAEQIRDMVRSEKLRVELMDRGVETFEEADDFEVGDDYDPRSPFEEVFDPLSVADLKRKAADEVEAERAKAAPPVEPLKPATPATAAPAAGGGPVV